MSRSKRTFSFCLPVTSSICRLHSFITLIYNQSNNQSIKRSINQSRNQSINQLVDYLTIRLFTRSDTASNNHKRYYSLFSQYVRNYALITTVYTILFYSRGCLFVLCSSVADPVRFLPDPDPQISFENSDLDPGDL